LFRRAQTLCWRPMCGRVFVKTNLDGMLNAFAFAGREEVEGMGNEFPLWNGAPGRDYPIIIRDVVRDAGEPVYGPVFIRANWGLIPSWSKDRVPGGKRPPINARCETIAVNGMFKDAYRYRRALMPIDGFFEWKDIFGTGRDKQAYAVAMKDDSPFALAAIWESWRDPETGEVIKSFAVVTCEPNVMMARIHDRMPVILRREDYDRWFSEEPDPRDIMRPYPSELMKMWPIGKKVGKQDNNSPDILDPVEPTDPSQPPPRTSSPKRPPKPPADDPQGSLF